MHINNKVWFIRFEPNFQGDKKTILYNKFSGELYEVSEIYFHFFPYFFNMFFDLYDQGGEKFYCGYDPTADSLHLGHFLTFMAAVNFMKRGNTFVMLIGGATGMI